MISRTVGRPQCAHAGMTLVELLVGLVLVGAALAIGYAAFTGVAEQRERAMRAMDETERAAFVRSSLIEWLEDVRLEADRNDPPFRGLDAVWGTEPDDQLFFLTTAPVFPGGRAAQVHLFIDRGGTARDRGLVAVLSEWRGRLSERFDLAPAATGLDIRYLFEFGKRRWVPGWVSSSALPLGVELRITAQDRDSLPPLLRRPILVALGAAE